MFSKEDETKQCVSGNVRWNRCEFYLKMRILRAPDKRELFETQELSNTTIEEPIIASKAFTRVRKDPQGRMMVWGEKTVFMTQANIGKLNCHVKSILLNSPGIPEIVHRELLVSNASVGLSLNL